MGLVKWLIRIAVGAGGVAGVALALLFLFQEKLLYVPKIPGVPDDFSYPPERYGFVSEDVTLTTSDEVKLHAWLLALRHWTPEFIRSRPVILFFQENAGNMSFRLPMLRQMALRLECPIFAVSYRGYGLSSGRPNEAGLKRDAETALAYLRTRQDVDASRVVVYGRSLGGAVALHLVANNQDKVSALIVENTFTSVEDMVSRVVPLLGAVIGPGKPLNFLVTNKWYNRRAVATLDQVPLLLVVSERDEMVPASQMHELHRLAQGRVKNVSLLPVPGAHHMDAYDHAPDLYWGTLRTFLDKHVPPRGAL